MRRTLVSSAAAVCAVSAAVAFGQGGPAAATLPPGNVMGLVSITRTVNDLDKGVAFYHDVIGLDIERQDKAPVADKEFQQAAGLPATAKVRRAVLTMPANTVKLELIEVTGVKRTPVVTRTQDAGNTNIVFRVRDVATAVAASKKMGATAITAGGEPMERGRNANNPNYNLSIFMHDPDGLCFQMEQPMPELPANAPPGKVLSAMLVTGGTYGKKVEFYKALGIELRKGNPMPWELGREQVLAPGLHSSVVNSPVLIPGSTDRWTVIEFPEGDGKPLFTGNVQDPGISMFTMRVHDAAAAAEAAKASGGSVVSAGGAAVKTAKGASVIVRDPEGFLLQLIQGE